MNPEGPWLGGGSSQDPEAGPWAGAERQVKGTWSWDLASCWQLDTSSSLLSNDMVSFHAQKASGN